MSKHSRLLVAVIQFDSVVNEEHPVIQFAYLQKCALDLLYFNSMLFNQHRIQNIADTSLLWVLWDTNMTWALLNISLEHYLFVLKEQTGSILQVKVGKRKFSAFKLFPVLKTILHIFHLWGKWKTKCFFMILWEGFFFPLTGNKQVKDSAFFAIDFQQDAKVVKWLAGMWDWQLKCFLCIQS